MKLPRLLTIPVLIILAAVLLAPLAGEATASGVGAEQAKKKKAKKPRKCRLPGRTVGRTDEIRSLRAGGGSLPVRNGWDGPSPLPELHLTPGTSMEFSSTQPGTWRLLRLPITSSEIPHTSDLGDQRPQ